MALNGPCAKFKSRLCQYSIAFTVNLAALSIAVIHIWPIFANHQLGSGSYGYTLEVTEISWLMFSFPLVSAIGGIAAAAIMNKIGRKNLIMMTALPLTASCILLAAGNKNIYLFIATTTASLMNGVLHVAVPVYLSEIADAEIRGFLLGTFPLTQWYGSILVSLLLPYVTIDASILAYVSSTFTVVTAVLLVFLPESPYQFALRGNYALAAKSSSKLRRRRDVTEEMERIRRGLEEHGWQRSVIYLLKNRTYVKCLLISLLVVLTHVLSGSTGTFHFSAMIFRDASFLNDPTRITLAVLTLILYLTPMVTLCLVDRVGRRPLLLLAVGTIAVCQLANGIISLLKFKSDTVLFYLALVPLYICNLANYAVMDLIRMMITVEIFPANIAGAGLCVINLFSTVAGVLFYLLVYKFLWIYGDHFIFFIGSISCFVGFCLLFKFLPETKLKTIEKIQRDLKSRKNIGYVIPSKVEEVESML